MLEHLGRELSDSIKNSRWQSEFVDAVALLTVSRFRIAYGVVRLSAGMVGILLDSCFQRQNSNELPLTLRAVLSERRRVSNEPRGTSQKLLEDEMLTRSDKLQMPDRAES